MQNKQIFCILMILLTGTVLMSCTHDKPGVSDESYTRLFWAIGDTNPTSTTITMSVGDSRQIDVYGETTDGRAVKLTQECGIYVRDESIAAIDANSKLVAIKKSRIDLYRYRKHSAYRFNNA